MLASVAAGPWPLTQQWKAFERVVKSVTFPLTDQAAIHVLSKLCPQTMQSSTNTLMQLCRYKYQPSGAVQEIPGNEH